MIAYGQPPRPMVGMRYAMTGERDDAGGGAMPGMRLRQLMGAPAMTGGPQVQPNTGGNLPAQPFNPQTTPQFNGQFPQASYGTSVQGYPHGGSNGGINPGGMYGAGFGQPTYPAGLAGMFNRYRGF